jgi:menaquinone-dependent protoporphyrinogen oxidase
MDGPRTVLVGYATAAGSTRGIAERIADRLAGAGLQVACRALSPQVDPAGFDAWVVGSAVHSMSWLPEATGFLSRAAADQRSRPCWCFSVGGMPPTGRLRRWMGAREVRRVERGFPAGLAVRGHALFVGVLVTAGVPWLGRVFWRALGGRPGDQRDWPGIDRWADGVAADLLGERTAGASRATPRAR